MIKVAIFFICPFESNSVKTFLLLTFYLLAAGRLF